VLVVVTVSWVPWASVLPLCVSVVVVLKSAEELPECTGPVVSDLHPLGLSAHDWGAAKAAAAPPTVIIIASSAAVTNMVILLIIYRSLLSLIGLYCSPRMRRLYPILWGQ
jgi:hypothetical protein